MSAASKIPSVLEVKIEVLSAGPLQGKAFIFQQENIKIGRGPENDLSLPGDLKVSREHALIQVSSKAVYLRSLNEKNPIWFEGEWIQQKQIPPGAQIRIGDTEIRLFFKGGVSTAVPVTKHLSQDPYRSDFINTKVLLGKNLNKAVPNNTQNSSSLAAVNGSSPAQQGAMPSPNWSALTAAATRGSGMRGSRTRPRVQSNSSENRLMFYLLIAGVIGGAFWLIVPNEKSGSKGLQLRDKVVSEAAIQVSQDAVENLEKEISKAGRDTVQFRLAEEQFHRGFRDYLNGQYSRAMEQFQAALSFFPEHRQSRRYFHLARRKFDQQIQSYMRQGQRYYGVQNYRLCVAFYSKVVTMIRDQNNPQKREALQFMRECQAKIQAGGL
jgi:pSer/pThr/pTyr-binding forkhead associated (FHA) protein